jgi:hypothetical protein
MVPKAVPPAASRGFNGFARKSSPPNCRPRESGDPVTRAATDFARRWLLDARWSLYSGQPKTGPECGHDYDKSYGLRLIDSWDVLDSAVESKQLGSWS